MTQVSRIGWGALGVAWLVASIGCGPGSQLRPEEPPATPEEGEGFEARWEAATETFARHEQAGWSAEACAGVAQAFRMAAHATDAGPRAADAHYMAGMSHQRCGARGPAQTAYEAALGIRPGYCKARVGLGLAQLAGGSPAEAERSFRRAVEADRTCTEGWMNLGLLARRRGNLDEATVHLRRALAVDSAYVQAFHELALVHLDRAQEDASQLDVAAIVCRQAQQIDPEYAPLYNTWAIVDLQRGRVVEALQKLEHATTLDPELFEAHMNFGQITLSFRGYEDAERAFHAALALRARDYDALVGHGIALRGLHRVDEARERYAEARGVDPTRPEAWFNLGVLHQDHLEGSVEDLRRAEGFFETFVSRANGDPDFAEEVEEVERCCAPGRGRAARSRCHPGRLQNLQSALHALGGGPAPSC